MERILVINGATREDGNTDVIVKKLAEGILTAGLKVRCVTLRELNISDCIGCCQCLRESTCHFQDDMTGLRDAVVAADVLVFASPIYWCEVTALMKTFIDRLYFYHHKANSSLVAGKKALLLTTLGEKDAAYESEVLIEFYKRCLRSLGITILDMLFFPELMEKEDIEQRPDYLEIALNTGKKIAASVSNE
ncbi:flavodoxin family protein [Chloroflexota bacterium]